MRSKIKTNALFSAIIMASASYAIADDTTQLETVKVTSAAGFEQNIADAPASISVISAEELNKKSYTSVLDAIKNIPGVYMTGGGGMGDISIRGMSAAYTMYLVDGRPVSRGASVNTNGTDGGKQIGLPPISMIERIEVIRGPMSSLYGSDAMGGVINIITKKNSKEWHGSVNGEWTHSKNDINNDKYKTDVMLGGGIVEGLLGLQLNGSWIKTEESDLPTANNKSSASTPKGENKEGGAKILFTPNDTNTIALGYTKGIRDYTHNPGKSLDILNSQGNPNDSAHTRYEKDIYVLSHDGNYGNWQISSYAQHDVSENVSNSDKEKKEQLTILNTQATAFVSGHAVTVGAQYRDEKVIDETNGLLSAGITGAVREADRWIAAGFTEVDWNITNDLSITTGLRYNDDEFFGSHLSPRLYSVYHLTDNLTLKGGISTGYKQPSLGAATPGFGQGTGGKNSVNYAGKASAKDDETEEVSSALIIGNADLKPETSTSYEVGYVFEDKDLGLNTSMMVFYTQYKDKIAEDRFCTSPNAADNTDYTNFACDHGGTDYSFLSTGMNIAKADLKGVELTLDYLLSEAVKFSGSYTFTESEQKSGEFKGKALNKMPKHMLNANIDWNVSEQFIAWTQFNYRGKTSDYLSRTSMSDGTPGYGFVDIGFTFKATQNVTTKFGIYNISNKEVTNGDYEVVLDGNRVNFGLSVDF